MKIHSEKGQALPLVIIAVLIGALVIPPFLGHVGTSLIGSRAYAQELDTQYACDAGAEHAIWNLTDGSILSSLMTAGSTVSYTLPESVNGLTTDVKISNSWETIAWDDFESAGWAGGGGWLNDWTNAGDSSITNTGTPYEGTYHMMLRSSTGVVSRAVDLSMEVNAHVRFQAKANGFESGDEAILRVSQNGTDWTTVHTWTTSDSDNLYHFYDFDLTSYGLTSSVWVSFQANMNGTSDYFYVDNLDVVWLASVSDTVSDEDFESGGWAGGDGWLDVWTHTGTANVTVDGIPYQGSYHLLIQGADGYVERPLDLSAEYVVRLQFWAKAESFEGGESVDCLVSSNGIDWDIAYTWSNGDDDAVYHYYDIDLSGYDLSTGEFWIAFKSNMSNTYDYFYVDDINVISIRAFAITATAADRTLKAAVDVTDSGVIVLCWYIKK